MFYPGDPEPPDGCGMLVRECRIRNPSRKLKFAVSVRIRRCPEGFWLCRVMFVMKFRDSASDIRSVLPPTWCLIGVSPRWGLACKSAASHTGLTPCAMCCRPLRGLARNQVAGDISAEGATAHSSGVSPTPLTSARKPNGNVFVFESPGGATAHSPGRNVVDPGV